MRMSRASSAASWSFRPAAGSSSSQHRRGGGDRAGDGDRLALPERDAVGPLVDDVGELELLDRLDRCCR